MKMIQPITFASACTLACLLISTFAFSQTVEKNQIVTSDANSAYKQTQTPKAYNISAGSLTQTLNRFAQQTGVVLVFNPDLTEAKNSICLSGQFTPQTGFAQILKGTGLEATSNASGGFTIIKAPPPAVVKVKAPNLGEKDSVKDIQLDAIQVRAKRFHEIGPLPGLGLTKEEIPGNVQSITAKEIKESHSLSLADLMNTHLQSVSVNDYQGNPFQMDLNYRGFTASPQLGTAQGISVYLDGIRVNEPFGDVVNWDMIPMNALTSLDVFPGSNPIFGLGTLGGALSMRTKSGFLDPGLNAEILAGSYGRKQLQISSGGNNGVIAGFVSGNFFLEDGWRDNSPSKVNQVFGKAEWRNDKVQLGLSMLYAGNKLTGNGLLPQQMANESRSQVYTSPDVSKNDLLQFQLNGIWDVTDTFNITGQLYHRNSKRKSKTTDVNEDFGAGATATKSDLAGKNVLTGFQDINKDGLPDYNNLAFNVAADANGYALDVNGNAAYVSAGAGGFTDNSIANGGTFDIANLAIGTNFADNSDLSTAVQATQGHVAPANDPNGVPLSTATILNWTYIPGEGPYNNVQSANPSVFNTALPTQYYQFALDQWKIKAIQQLNIDPYAGTYGGFHVGTGREANKFRAEFINGQAFGQYTDAAGFFMILRQFNH